MALRQFAGGAKPTKVTGDFNAEATAFNVDDGTGWPDGSVGPFTIVVNRTGATAEKMLATARTGTIPATITVPLANRGYDGTAAAAHFANESAEHVATAEDMRDANAHIFDTTRDDHPQYVLTSEHTKALHDALALDHGSLSGRADDDHPQYVKHTHADAKGDLLAATGPDVFGRLAVPADTSVFMADSAQAAGWRAIVPATTATVAPVGDDGFAGTSDTWARGDHAHPGDLLIFRDIVDAKGDLIVATAADTVGRLAVPANNKVHIGDSAQSTGYGTSDVAFGTLGYAEATGNQGPITTEQDLTSLSVTVTVGTNRRVRITGLIRVASTVGNDVARLRTYEGGTALVDGFRELPVANIAPTFFTQRILTPSAGSHTYKLALRRESGTGTLTMNADAATPVFILVEDIGRA